MDLSTTYLGLDLPNPLVASSGPLTERIDTLKRLADAGIAAVVLPSLFQEEVEHGDLEFHWARTHGTEAFPEALDYLPDVELDSGPDRYLRRVEEARAAVDVPVVASLNGSSKSGWERYASLVESAGASALELNVYFVPTDPTQTAADVEQRQLDLIAAVRSQVRLPLAVKLSPFFSSPANFARRAVEAGADGLVLFNRFYQPDLDLENMQVVPNLVLSGSSDLRLPLRWIAVLSGVLDCSLAAASGVHTAADALKALFAGADVAMSTSALLKFGPEHVGRLLEEMSSWLVEHEYESVEQLKGSLSQRNSPDPEAFERANYQQTLRSYSTSYEVP